MIPARLTLGALSGLLAGILYTAVINGVERFDQRAFNQVELFERQAALVELPIEQLFHGDIIHQVLNA